MLVSGDLRFDLVRLRTAADQALPEGSRLTRTSKAKRRLCDGPITRAQAAISIADGLHALWSSSRERADAQMWLTRAAFIEWIGVSHAARWSCQIYNAWVEQNFEVGCSGF